MIPMMKPQAVEKLDEITPRPGNRAVGEERAWGRRLAKRFGVEQAGQPSGDLGEAVEIDLSLLWTEESEEQAGPEE